ncbi:peptide-methionine (S)-S-oxide reductase MsrA [soil metagenome]
MTTTAKATFGAGCFWGIEAAFRQVPGVVSTEVGYMGGTVDEPGYRQVCTGRTGHAEVVQVTYDPERLSFDDVLAVFWDIHDPTTRDRQGPDVGTQYRSAVFVHDDDQEKATRRSIDELEAAGRFRRPIVTEVTPAATFWSAEDYHQQYLEKRGLSTCRI